MTETEQQAVIAIALLATVADGRAAPEEQASLQATIGKLGAADLEAVARKVSGGNLQVADVAKDLTTDESRNLAYQTALAICHADGTLNPGETAFLATLRQALGIAEQPAALPGGQSVGPDAGAIDQFILDQAILTGAVELLPDAIANIAIIPLQLRLVYQIGQRYGQQLDASQAKDLAATLGIGVTAQLVEGVVRKAVGGIAKGILGGLIGGVTEAAAGSAVTFAATYALGHVAKQYYSQGRKLSGDDLRALFAKFQTEAKTIFPKVEDRIVAQSKTLNLPGLLGGVR